MAGRVLCVDDFEPWRRQIAAELQRHPEWQLVGEASDGAQAVQQAEALKPDLILLDIGLPMRSGIEAAGQILATRPDARILFVTEHRTCDIAEAALTTGARGYILKSDAGRELLPAMEAIAARHRFVSARLGGRGVDTLRRMLPQRHEMAFDSRDSDLIDRYASRAAAALEGGHGLMVALSEERRKLLNDRLHERGIDYMLAAKQGRYLQFAPAELLAQFMVDGWPDDTRFWKAGISLVMQVARVLSDDHRRLIVCGEGAPTLWREGQAAAAIRVEQLWDELSMTFKVDTLCGYSLAPEENHDDERLQQIGAAHSVVHTR